ncbi:Epidermal patterning factor-like protein 6 [Vitis vinifera]|uniref:Epidermal patterning factor-like protein n=1 Tax=Vitis vinifera TaxID=29760 RepID=A0A438F9C7_VITVI|nr:Epidermal patterning factor-like protein 6 [Vitis vinifera]
MELKNSTALRFMHRPRLIYLTISIFFLSICALLTSISSTRTACLDIKCSLNADGDLYFQANLGYNEPMGSVEETTLCFQTTDTAKMRQKWTQTAEMGVAPPTTISASAVVIFSWGLGNMSLMPSALKPEPCSPKAAHVNPIWPRFPIEISMAHRTLIDKTLNNSEQKRTIQTNRGVPFSLARRYLSGPGSSPPRCTSKCGKCTPCKPVHVAVPPGTPVTTEYYPEAWRCKCGNKLYMP